MKKVKTYWDSSCFLSWLKAEPQAELCRGTIAEAERGNILIITSAITVVEVIKLKGREPITRDHSDQIIAFFSQGYVRVRNIDLAMAELARDLMWTHSALAHKDALHVATAVAVGCPILETFDKELIKLSGQIGDPPLRITEPSIPFQPTLFAERE